jgi:hypothetical protein
VPLAVPCTCRNGDLRWLATSCSHRAAACGPGALCWLPPTTLGKAEPVLPTAPHLLAICDGGRDRSERGIVQPIKWRRSSPFRCKHALWVVLSRQDRASSIYVAGHPCVSAFATPNPAAGHRAGGAPPAQLWRHPTDDPVLLPMSTRHVLHSMSGSNPSSLLGWDWQAGPRPPQGLAQAGW